MKIKMSWAQYTEALDKIVDQLSNEKFDVIIGLTRGGLIPAVYLSHALGIPMMAFNPHSLKANGTPRENIILPISPSVVRKILIVDDISDTGKTFAKCSEFFIQKGFVCKTASVYNNEEVTIFKPNFTVLTSDKKWVIFPYEREEE